MAYKLGREIQRLEALLPPEPGLRAHLFRVSALAARAAESQGMLFGEIESIASMALLHHSGGSLDVEAGRRLGRDLGVEMESETEPVPGLAGIALKRLNKTASALVESANLFDEQIENLPYEGAPVEETLRDLLTSGMVSKAFAAGIQSFRAVTREQLSAAIKKLPVFPKAAMDALSVSRDPEAGIREIEIAVSRDPVLAGETMQMANSGLFGKSTAVRTLSAALARVGTLAAAHMIATAALKRCFASANLTRLWQHSFDTGEACAKLAGEAKGVDASDAFLAGLLHDVGRLGYEFTPAAEGIRSWQAAGFPVTYAELLVSGIDHTDIGAEILTQWCFPDRFIEAVRFHHRPEVTQSALAATIYAAEDTGEALPSLARDHMAIKRLELAAFPRAQAGD